MLNIAILVYDYSLLGGVQRVTCNLAQLMHQNEFPLKCVISIFDSKVVEYEYPVDVEVVGDGNDMYTRIYECMKKYDIHQFVVQVENLKFLYPIINFLIDNDCKVYPVLHSSPYNWIRKYYTFEEYLISPRYIYQWFKMQLYWKSLHMNIFHDLVNKCGIICVSNQARKEMCEILNMPNDTDKIRYVYNPVMLEPNNDTSEKENLIIYAGRINPDKRPLLLLKVWRELECKYPDWKFLLLGDGPLSQKMSNYILKHNLHNVTLVGAVNNVADYLKRSKISILLSKYEGLPTVMIEACYNDNALVASINDGGTPDVVVEGVNGFLVSPQNLHQIVGVMSSLMNNNGEKAVELGKNNIEVRKKFDNHDILKSWETILS